MTPSSPAAGALPRAMFSSNPGPHPMLRGPSVAYAPEDDAGGGLSLEAATALLDTHEDEDQAAAAPEAKPAAEIPAAGDGDGQQSEGETSTPEDTTGEAETQTQDGEGTEATETGAAAPLEPPKYWSQDAKAAFAELPPSLQAVVLAQEGPREQATAKAKDEAAQVRAKADQEIAGIQEFAEQVKTWLPQAVQTFRSRWGDNPDWVKYAEQNGGEAMSIAKAQYEAERTQLQQAAQAAQVAEDRAHTAYVQAQAKELETLAPDLADPKEGAARRTEVGTFLQGLGIPAAALKQISAVELTLARDAMLWRRAQAKSAPNPAPKPAAATTRPLSRGAAAAGPTDPKAKVAAAASTKFQKTGSIDDAVAFLNSQDD